MKHEKLIEKHLGINTPYWIKEKVNNSINEALMQPLKDFCQYCESRQIEPKRFKWEEIIKDFETNKQ